MVKESRLFTYCNSLQLNTLSDLDKIFSTSLCPYGKKELPEASEHFFREIFSSSQSLNSNNYVRHVYDAHEQQLPKKTHIAMSRTATSYTNQFTTWKRLTIIF